MNWLFNPAEPHVQRLEDEQMAAENEAVLFAEEDVEDDEQYVQRLEDEQMAAENEAFWKGKESLHV